MHENQAEQRASISPPKTILNGATTFVLRRQDIYRRLQQSAEKCKLNYSERKELATEKDENVVELCEALEDAFTYGLQRPQQQSSNVGVAAVNFFQNMQEIVTNNIGISSGSSNDYTFWDFCEMHLTMHERERYKDLKQIWTKCGRGKAFIRATLNEHSLQRYLLTWLYDTDELRNYYSPWSLLLDTEASKELPKIVGSLDRVLFALAVDTTELNSATRANVPQPVFKEEPIIYAPSPVPISNTKNKRKSNIIERPIFSANSAENLVKSLNETMVNTLKLESSQQIVEVNEEFMVELELPPPDPIEPELEFLKQPLPDFFPENHNGVNVSNDISSSNTATEEDCENKSDSSSLYSKSSSANGLANQTALEEKLREVSERCALLETRVAQLSFENRQLTRKLTKYFKESGVDPSSSLTTNFLITIPTVKLLKTKRGNSYYAYEIHITMRQNLEHWMIMRRYREFDKLHKSLMRTHPTVGTVEFPPKKHFGNMKLVFVEERRQQLQIYLLNLVEILPQVEACKTKTALQKAFPFFRER